jgi:3-hydroxyisobutyrate dehydrogenase
MQIGFIGLGSQGGPMARRIIEAGYPMTLWARRPETLEPFADTAAKVAETPAELGAASDLVCLCVVGDADIDEITGGERGLLAGLKPGSVIAVHSTVHPDTCKTLAKKAGAQGVSVIDAPVSGGGPAAENGRLLVMVGGDADVVERCRPVFASYADPVVHLGAWAPDKPQSCSTTCCSPPTWEPRPPPCRWAKPSASRPTASPRSSPAVVETASRST